MPYDAERRATLYYDSSCGPCRFFARSAEGLGHGRLTTAPLDSPSATSDLGDLPDEARYGAGHLVGAAGRSSGPDLPRALVGIALGPTAGRLLTRFPTIERPLRWLYRAFWTHRRDHGCAASARGS